MIQTIFIALRGSLQTLSALLYYVVVFSLLGMFWSVALLEDSQTTQILVTVILGLWIMFRRGPQV